MEGRPAIVDLDVTEEGAHAHISVTLAWGDARYTGEAVGDASPSLRSRIVGEATLRAVEAVMEGRLRLGLESVATTELGNNIIALAEVSVPGIPQAMVGSAVVEGQDAGLATVRAVMAALNRPLGRLI